MLWIIVILSLALIIGGFLTGHWFFGIINGIVVFCILRTVGLTNKRKSFIIPGVLGSAVMIGGSIFGIQIKHPVIAGIIGLVFNFGLFCYITSKDADETQKALETRAAAGDKAAKEELQKKLETRAAAGDKAAKEELEKQIGQRKALETRAFAGDEAAKQELIELGTDVSGFFPYFNFDFDEDALQRVYNMLVTAMMVKGIPWIFEMEELKTITVGKESPLNLYEWKGKTPKGETIYMQYQIGKHTPGKVSYNLHLKLLPEIAQDIKEMVEKGMENFLSTVPKWDG
jgi:hypothetical protein